MFRKILVAIDGTSTSRRGLAAAIALAKEQTAALYVLHVVDEMVIAPMIDGSAVGAAGYVEVMLESLRKTGREIVATAERAASKDVATVRAEMIASRGQPVATMIVRYAKRVGADLIVLGTHGRRGISRLLMGSDAEAVLREATVPVLLVRSAKRKPARERRSPRVPAGSSRRKVPSQAAAAARA